MKNDIKILIACHKPTTYIKSDIMQPIQLGCANAKTRLPGMVYDNDGDNISSLNPMYCELTAQYWAWKNLDCEYYGFCHYRRYFNFSDNRYSMNSYNNVIEKSIDDSIIQRYGLSDSSIRKAIDGYDIITTDRLNLQKMPEHFHSVEEHYTKAPHLHEDDLKRMLDIIDNMYPEYSDFAHEYCSGHFGYFCNMYIMKKEIFFNYCKWMFPILSEFVKSTDFSNYSSESLRTPGHLSERLFGIYLSYISHSNKSLRIKEVQCVLFENTVPQSIIRPMFNDNAVNVVFASSEEFVPIFSTCFQSLIMHSNPNRHYDVVLFSSNITEDSRHSLKEMLIPDNISLRFFNTTCYTSNYNLRANAHISIETYYRFIIQSAMPDYKKVLYLDCDVIINEDISTLFDTDIDNYILAAARDPDFLGQINGALFATQLYCKNQFKMKNHYNYFQAGVLLFNEDEMRKLHSLNEWLDLAMKPYKYLDQDILNAECEGRVKYLDMSWNVLTDCAHARINKIISFAPDQIQKEYVAARLHPKILHYAGYLKPWHHPSEDFAFDFWKVARLTPFYEELLYRMSQGIAYWSIVDHDHNKHLSVYIKRIIRRAVDVILPKGTLRREQIKKILKR